MILVETSVWIDHLRTSNKILTGLLEDGLVLIHPFVLGEIALGNLRQREVVMRALQGLPSCRVAVDDEVLHFINRFALFGRGVGYLDMHLLAATRITAGTQLWTTDKRLAALAAELAVAFNPPPRRVA